MQWHCCINEATAEATSFLLGSIRWGTPEWNPFQVSLCHISHFCWLSWDRLPWNEICWDVFRARFWSQKGMQWCEAPSPTFLLSLLLPLSPSPRAQHWRYFPIGKLSDAVVRSGTTHENRFPSAFGCTVGFWLIHWKLHFTAATLAKLLHTKVVIWMYLLSELLSSCIHYDVNYLKEQIICISV